MNGIIEDTLNGAIILSVFDFIMCFFVLWFFGLFIRGLSKLGNKD